MKKTLFGIMTILLLLTAGSSLNVSPSLAAIQVPTEVVTPEPTLPPKEDVEIPMDDGLKVKGTFYSSRGNLSPAALLLHQNDGSRYDWVKLIPALSQAGYSVLTVDQRGFGAMGGDKGWSLGESDAKTMMMWLRAHKNIDPNRIAVIGGSVGANVAIRVCAEDNNCHVVIGLSPGLGFFGVSTKPAVQKMQNKAVLLVAGQKDGESSQAVRTLQMWIPDTNNVTSRLYANSPRHAAALLSYPDLIPLIMNWLEMYNLASS